MGVFDSVFVPCPKCQEKVEFQSKSGPRCMLVFNLEEAPDDVLRDVNRHAPVTCPKCGTSFYVGIREGRYASVKEGEGCILTVREILAARIAQGVRSGILTLGHHYGISDEIKDLAERLAKEAYDWAITFDEVTLGERMDSVEKKRKEAEEERKKVLDELVREAEKNNMYDRPPDETKGGDPE